MELATCRNCGRLFNVISREKICPGCKSLLEDRFHEVKKYLDENPNTTVEMLSKECDIPIKQIKDWIREERLSFREGTGCGINCEQCGAMIYTGRFCEACKQKLQSDLNSALSSSPKRETSQKKDRDRDRMRFLQNL